jgi:hypothetical protein
MLLKDAAEHSVPEEWRPKFRQIARAFVQGDFELREHPITGVAPIDRTTADHFSENVRAFGEGVDDADAPDMHRLERQLRTRCLAAGTGPPRRM